MSRGCNLYFYRYQQQQCAIYKLLLHLYVLFFIIYYKILYNITVISFILVVVNCWIFTSKMVLKSYKIPTGSIISYYLKQMLSVLCFYIRKANEGVFQIMR